MSGKNQYKTKQRDALLSYLFTVPGTHVTAADICSHFRECGNPIGVSTVYRQLEKLVDEGLVNKYNIDSGSPACFEFIGSSEHNTDGICFHCKCEKCGRLIHLHCDSLAAIGSHLVSTHGFQLDPMRTVFYGLCAECREAE